MISLSMVMTGVSACAVPPTSDDEPTELANAELLEDVGPTSPVDEGADAGSDEAAAPTAAEVLAKLATCRKVSRAPYAKDQGGTSNIDICDLSNAVFFKADMDIDCDGKPSAVCNRGTDASYQSSTAAVDSKGKYLDAAALPFVVVPGVSSRWSYRTSGIKMGSLAAVIYNGKIEYGVVGDVGPVAIVGEASYAMAKRLGINPNPSTGGVASGVTYVIFKGAGSGKMEDNVAATKAGIERAKKLIAEN